MYGRRLKAEGSTGINCKLRFYDGKLLLRLAGRRGVLDGEKNGEKKGGSGENYGIGAKRRDEREGEVFLLETCRVFKEFSSVQVFTHCLEIKLSEDRSKWIRVCTLGRRNCKIKKKLESETRRQATNV